MIEEKPANEKVGPVEVTLYDKQADEQVTCRVCEFRCVIPPGAVGRCKVRQNNGGTLIALNYGHITNAVLGPVDLQRVYHIYPGANSFAVGSYGCNFFSAEFPAGTLPACALKENQTPRPISAEKTVDVAKQRLCRGVVFAYSEASMWFEYLLSTVKMAKASGQFTLALANGYWTPEALDLIGPYLDGLRLSLNTLDPALHETMTGTKGVDLIQATAIRAQQQHYVHIEVATDLTEGLNDNVVQAIGIANWIVRNLGPQTPWHINAAAPLPGNPEKAAVPASTLEQWILAGRNAGLSFVYTDHPEITDGRNTVCPKCQRVAIARSGESVQQSGMREGKCANCQTDLNIRSTIFKAELRARRRDQKL